MDSIDKLYLQKEKTLIKYYASKLLCELIELNYELGNYLITTLSLYTICKKHNISADLLIGRKKEQ